MNKIVSIVLGLLILVGSLVLLYEYSGTIAADDPKSILVFVGMVAAMGWSYQVIHQVKYPTKVVSIVLISELVLLIVFGEDSLGRIVDISTVSLLIPGIVFTLGGPRLVKAATGDDK